ncbi:hypothetical protein FGG08_006710 [Glutinoglossum americanum]|uniref:Zn(2)-C6 fungal-type domain-containing protein n=1 Tax=Glutinoglossum americanum TaxID=1670608 RepID=A0A9P8L031_9PEZI|nr:hypothetical protein FGG08_006710 [Glutinoglossum americanum]
MPETTGCDRCQRDGIPCHYSSQKPMGRPRRKKEDEHRAPSPPPTNARYTANNTSINNNSIAISSNGSEGYAAFMQEQPQNQFHTTSTNTSSSSTSPSDSTGSSDTASTNTTPSHYESTALNSRDSPAEGRCVYGDPAMLVGDIRYNLVPFDILLRN